MGGQRQRIAIARAIVRDPSVLLLDEATSALDQTTEAAINRTLFDLAKGRTMIFSTHRLTSVVEMDEIIVVAGGRVVSAVRTINFSPMAARTRSSGRTSSIGRTNRSKLMMTTMKMRMTTIDGWRPNLPG